MVKGEAAGRHQQLGQIPRTSRTGGQAAQSHSNAWPGSILGQGALGPAGWRQGAVGQSQGRSAQDSRVWGCRYPSRDRASPLLTPTMPPSLGHIGHDGARLGPADGVSELGRPLCALNSGKVDMSWSKGEKDGRLVQDGVSLKKNSMQSGGIPLVSQPPVSSASLDMNTHRP